MLLFRLPPPSGPALLVTLTLLLAAPARSAEPDLNDLALSWARGQFLAPLVCQMDGRPQRVGRRVIVSPGPSDAHPRVDRLRIFAIEVPADSRCFDAFGKEEPEVAGTLQLTLPGRSAPDVAKHRFTSALRRDGGFDFEVRGGSLRVGRAGAGTTDQKTVDFAGGRARLRNIAPGSDAARLLGDLDSPRKLTLELEARDGTRFALTLVQFGAR